MVSLSNGCAQTRTAIQNDLYALEITITTLTQTLKISISRNPTHEITGLISINIVYNVQAEQVVTNQYQMIRIDTDNGNILI